MSRPKPCIGKSWSGIPADQIDTDLVIVALDGPKGDTSDRIAKRLQDAVESYCRKEHDPRRGPDESVGFPYEHFLIREKASGRMAASLGAFLKKVDRTTHRPLSPRIKVVGNFDGGEGGGSPLELTQNRQRCFFGGRLFVPDGDEQPRGWIRVQVSDRRPDFEQSFGDPATYHDVVFNSQTQAGWYKDQDRVVFGFTAAAPAYPLKRENLGADLALFMVWLDASENDTTLNLTRIADEEESHDIARPIHSKAARSSLSPLQAKQAQGGSGAHGLWQAASAPARRAATHVGANAWTGAYVYCHEIDEARGRRFLTTVVQPDMNQTRLVPAFVAPDPGVVLDVMGVVLPLPGTLGVRQGGVHLSVGGGLLSHRLLPLAETVLFCEPDGIGLPFARRNCQVLSFSGRPEARPFRFSDRPLVPDGSTCRIVPLTASIRHWTPANQDDFASADKRMLREFACIERKGGDSFGYIQLNVPMWRPEGVDRGQRYRPNEVVYRRRQAYDPIEDRSLLLDWLDNAVVLETRDPHAPAETRRQGYAEWLGDSLGNQAALAWPRQEFAISDKLGAGSQVYPLTLRKLSHTGEVSGQPLPVKDGQFLRIGPLIVRVRHATGG
ncbi:MAG: hypothetical protein ACT4OK_06265 [Gemmobacter sp.]